MPVLLGQADDLGLDRVVELARHVTGRRPINEAEEQDLEQRLAAQQTQQADHSDDREGAARERAAHAVEIALERRHLTLDRLQQPGDAPELGAHAGGCDHRPPAAVRDARACVDHVAPVAQRELLVRERFRDLLDRLRFSGEGGLVGPDEDDLDQACVRRNAVACHELQEVARHHLV